MPEIRNELPSDQELADYLDQSLQASSISLLADYPGNQSHYHPDLVEALAYLSSRPVSSEFLSSLKDSIFRSLQRLNRLPRTDPFWTNTNLRPTVPKVSEFCDKVLLSDPDDVTSLLTITAMVIFHTGEFHRGRWTQLLSQKAVSVPWIVFAAMFMEVCGADDSRDFSEFVTADRLSTTARPLLEEVGKTGGKFLAAWSYKVLALLAKH